MLQSAAACGSGLGSGLGSGPGGSVENPVVNRLTDVGTADPLGRVEIGDRAGHPQHLVVSPRREPQIGHCYPKQFRTGLVKLTEFAHMATIHTRVRPGRQPDKTVGLPLAGRQHLLAQLTAGGACAGGGEFAEGHGGHFEVDVDAIEEGPGNLPHVAFDLRGCALAFPAGIAAVAAGTGVEGSHEHEIGGKFRRRFRPADRHGAIRKRLPQHLKRPPVEFRQFVKEEHAVLGEANFSDHGANRLGASALMQGLADGYFIIPNTIGHYLDSITPNQFATSHEAFEDASHQVKQRIDTLLSIKGKRTVNDFHKELGHVMWEKCGMARHETGLKEALSHISKIRDEFWQNVAVVGEGNSLNQTLERAWRVADFIDFSALLVEDALHRKESCGGHFRIESQTPEGEAKRNDAEFSHVAAWEYTGEQNTPNLHKEELTFSDVTLSERSYK